MSMGLSAHVRAERHLEHLASCVAYGSMSLDDAVVEYMRYYQTTYAKAKYDVVETCNKIGVKHE